MIRSGFCSVAGSFSDRDSVADKLALDASLKALKEGKALAAFPEGERKSGPEVLPMLDELYGLPKDARYSLLVSADLSVQCPKEVTYRSRAKSLSFTETQYLHPNRKTSETTADPSSRTPEKLHTTLQGLLMKPSEKQGAQTRKLTEGLENFSTN